MSAVDPTAHALALALLEKPGDAPLRMVLADRLEELGDTRAADFRALRASCRLLCVTAGIDPAGVFRLDPTSHDAVTVASPLAFGLTFLHVSESTGNGLLDITCPDTGISYLSIAVFPSQFSEWRPGYGGTPHFPGGIRFCLQGETTVKFSVLLAPRDDASLTVSVAVTLHGTPEIATRRWLGELFPGANFGGAG